MKISNLKSIVVLVFNCFVIKANKTKRIIYPTYVKNRKKKKVTYKAKKLLTKLRMSLRIGFTEINRINLKKINFGITY